MKLFNLSVLFAAAGLLFGSPAVKASDMPNPEAPVAFLELIEVPAQDINQYIADWNERAATAGQASGYISATLYRSLLAGARYQLVAVTQWQSYDAWAAANSGANAKPAGGLYRPAAWSSNIYAESFQGNDSGAAQSTPLQRAEKDPEIKFPELPFVFINLMEMGADDIDPFVADWRVRSKIMGQMHSAMGSTLYRSVLPDNTFPIVNVSQWQSYNGFIDANNDPVYAEKLTADLGHIPSIKLTRGFYRPVASHTHTYNADIRQGKPEKMKIITIEEHFINPSMTAATRDEIEAMAPGHAKAFVADFGARETMQIGQLFDIGAGRIADMDANGIDMQILSYNAPAAELLPSPLAVELARQANDQLAAAIAAYPGRFLGFATLPMSDPEAAAEELKRCVQELGFKGAMINGTAHGRFMDHPDFEVFFAMAAELDVPLYFHPSIVNKQVRDAYYDNADPAFAARFASAGIGWHFEVGVHVMRLIFAGVFDRHPDLQIIMGHWGELIPFYMDRIDTFFPASASPMQHDFSYYMRNNIYITPSGMFNLPQLQNAIQTLGADRIIYSVDYPYYPNKGARQFLETAPLSQTDKEKIAHGNAEKLFKLK